MSKEQEKPKKILITDIGDDELNLWVNHLVSKLTNKKISNSNREILKQKAISFLNELIKIRSNENICLDE